MLTYDERWKLNEAGNIVLKNERIQRKPTHKEAESTHDWGRFNGYRCLNCAMRREDVLMSVATCLEAQLRVFATQEIIVRA